MANTGLGATVTAWPAGGTVANFRLISISGLTLSVETIDDTALTSTNYQELVPADLKTIGPITIELYWEWDEDLLTVGSVGTFTINFPLHEDDTTAGSLTGTGFVTELETPTLTTGEATTASMTIQFDGKTTEPTWTKNS